jgi:hypothetical protein
MQHITQIRNVYFLNFIQPTLYNQDAMSQFENDMFNYSISQHPKIDYIFQYGYNRLRNTFDALQKEGFLAQDISQCLNGANRNPGQEFYTDHCHINHHANELVAREIFNHLQKALSGSQKDP